MRRYCPSKLMSDCEQVKLKGTESKEGGEKDGTHETFEETVIACRFCSSPFPAKVEVQNNRKGCRIMCHYCKVYLICSICRIPLNFEHTNNHISCSKCESYLICTKCVDDTKVDRSYPEEYHTIHKNAQRRKYACKCTKRRKLCNRCEEKGQGHYKCVFCNHCECQKPFTQAEPFNIHTSCSECEKCKSKEEYRWCCSSCWKMVIDKLQGEPCLHETCTMCASLIKNMKFVDLT